MNSLSWWLYLTDVFGSIGNVLETLTVGSTGVFVATVVVFGIAAGEDKDLRPVWRKIVLHWWVPFVFFIGAAVIPSEKTMYLILASEVGQDVIESPEVIKIKTIINSKLDELTTQVTKGEN